MKQTNAACPYLNVNRIEYFIKKALVYEEASNHRESVHLTQYDINTTFEETHELDVH